MRERTVFSSMRPHRSLEESSQGVSGSQEGVMQNALRPTPARAIVDATLIQQRADDSAEATFESIGGEVQQLSCTFLGVAGVCGESLP